MTMQLDASRHSGVLPMSIALLVNASTLIEFLIRDQRISPEHAQTNSLLADTTRSVWQAMWNLEKGQSSKR